MGATTPCSRFLRIFAPKSGLPGSPSSCEKPLTQCTISASADGQGGIEATTMKRARLHPIPISLLGILALSLTATLPARALPAPQFLPGQPMIVGNQVLMMWAPVPGATRYAIYRNARRLEQVTANQYLGPLPEEPGQHRYQVAAVDAAGAEGEKSEPGLIRVRKLGTPRNLVTRADPGSSTIGLVWDLVQGAVIYNVYRSEPGEEKRLVASVQAESYKDASVRAGVAYTYSVTAKDLAGLESAPGTAAPVQLTPARTESTTRIRFRALPTTEVLSIEEIAGSPIEQVSDLKVGPKGRIWVVTPKTREIHALDRSGFPEITLGPFTFSDTRYAFLPQKMAFGPDGRIYVTDAMNSVIACIDVGGDFLWARGILTPPNSVREAWKNLPDHMKSLPATPSSVLCLPEEIWVTDQRLQLVYRLDYGGELLGYTASYTRQGKRTRLPGVGELASVGKDRILLTFPWSHRAVVVDPAGSLLYEIGTGDPGYIGGFVGIHGVDTRGREEILLTDPAVGSLQAFSAKDGRYLYHVSGPTPRLDPRYRQRADLPLRNPNLAVRDDLGRFWVYDAAGRRIAVLKPSGPLGQEESL